MNASSLTTAEPSGGALQAEAARRRTFAIISHPDAGKTTLTEKLLLYGGAIAEAGAVKARRSRRAATSDWMEMERERGISITSTVLRFEVGGTVFNLLDTPGHRDFSEDTLRVLAAADAAVMLLDAAKGIEEQTLKLFQVAHERRTPLLTFVNKYDRPALEPLALLDEIERELGLGATPVTWPVGMGPEFEGVADRRQDVFHRYTRTPGGASEAPEERIDIAGAADMEGGWWAQAAEELALLDAVGARLDTDAFLRGDATPVFFGSALSNFGVRLLLDALIELAPPPSAWTSVEGEERPLAAPFSALVFKLQANVDPRHRDRLSFVRVCSGRFERGMRVINARTGKPLALNYAHQLFGQERETLDTAYPGDVVGLTGLGDLRVGDTLYSEPPVRYRPIPVLAPEHFVRARNRDTARYKQFRRGLTQLDEEGVVQVLREPRLGDQGPILAGAGPMQFEVAKHRLAREFGAEVALEDAPYRVARRVDAANEAVVAGSPHAALLLRADGTRVAAFTSDFRLRAFGDQHPDVHLDRFMVR